jgi:hypothetical protein
MQAFMEVHKTPFSGFQFKPGRASICRCRAKTSLCICDLPLQLASLFLTKNTLALVGVVYSLCQGPIELKCNLRTLLGNLLADIPNNGKTKIALIVLI